MTIYKIRHIDKNFTIYLIIYVKFYFITILNGFKGSNRSAEKALIKAKFFIFNILTGVNFTFRKYPPTSQKVAQIKPFGVRFFYHQKNTGFFVNLLAKSWYR